MSNGYTATVDELITQVREDLDEPLDTSTNLWDDSYLVTRLNRGLRQVWQTARETKENWFLRTLRSDDDALTLYGRAYDPAQLAVTAGATSLVLPPDFYEARAFEALPAADENTASVCFEWADLATEAFRSGLRVSADGTVRVYTVDVRWGDGGPRLLLSPAASSDATTVNTTLSYVFAPKEYAAGEALENSGFSRVMLDAAVAYTVLEATRKQGVATPIAIAQAAWQERIALVTRTSGPRQSQAPEVVEGFQEEWI